MVDFLHTERDKHCKALCCEGTQGIYLPYTKWQGCIHSVHLLIFQHRKLAQMLSEDWMLITVGDRTFFNMATASWGGLGYAYSLPGISIALM